VEKISGLEKSVKISVEKIKELEKNSKISVEKISELENSNKVAVEKISELENNNKIAVEKISEFEKTKATLEASSRDIEKNCQILKFEKEKKIEDLSSTIKDYEGKMMFLIAIGLVAGTTNLIFYCCWRQTSKKLNNITKTKERNGNQERIPSTPSTGSKTASKKASKK